MATRLEGIPMVRHLLLSVAILAAWGLLAAGPASRAGGAKPEVAADGDLSGKVVFVQTQKEAATLEKAQVRRLGGPLLPGRSGRR
jgi:hypothetical protein